MGNETIQFTMSLIDLLTDSFFSSSEHAKGEKQSKALGSQSEAAVET
jgi:hypothetical protein